MARTACFLLLFLCAAPAPANSPSLDAAIRESTTATLRGDYRDAAAVLEQAAAAAPAGEPRLAAALSTLGTLYWLQGRYVEAERALRRVVAFAEAKHGREHVEVARELSRLGGVLRAQGRYREAETIYWRAIRVLEPLFGVDHAYVAEGLFNLAEMSRLQQRHAEAESRYSRAYMIRSYLHGPESSPVGETLAGLAAVFAAQGRQADAAAYFERALRIAEKPPRSDQRWGRLDERDLRELHAPERETVAIKGRMFSKDGGPRHLEFAQHYDRLGHLYRVHGRYGDAEAMYRRSISIRSRAFGAAHPEVAQALGEVARVHALQGEHRRGLELAQEAAGLFANRIGAFGAERAEYARGERRRWRPVFLLELALLARGAQPGEALAPAFAALQLANTAADAERPLELAEAQALLAPGEALLACAAGEAESFFVLVRRAGATFEAHAAPRCAPPAALREALSGAARVYLVQEGAQEPGARSFVRLQSIGALRRRQGSSSP